MKEKLNSDERDQGNALDNKNLKEPKILRMYQTSDFPIFYITWWKNISHINTESLKSLQISCGVQVVF